MNAVVALCHFCEAHGPRIVFCCQPFHDEHEQPAPLGDEFVDGNMSEDGVGGALIENDEDDDDEDDDDDNESSEYPNSSTVKRKKRPIFYGKYEEYFDVASDASLEQAKTNDTCNACRSMKSTKPGFLSNDHENRISYLGSQFPYHPEVFTIVRQACVRSLSCEVCPGREGPIFFGNEQYGYCLCYPFTLKDSKARGFQRWYSYCIVSMDKLLLLNFYDLLTGALKLLVDFLQRAAKAVFDNEQASRHGGENLPQIAASGRLGWLPSGFMRERAGSSSSGVARSLVELSGDNAIFSKLQSYFVWVLRLPSLYVVEQVLEGLPTQDELVRLELFRDTVGLTENGFACNEKNGKQDQAVNGHVNDVANDGSDEVNNTKFEHHSDYNQEIQDVRDVAHLRQLFHIFGLEAFRILAYHVVIGNQVVVKSESIELTEIVLNALKFILPLGCCHVIYSSDVYIERWRCNLLGLSDTGCLPESFNPAANSSEGTTSGDDQLVLVSAKIVDNQQDDLHQLSTGQRKSINMDRCSFRLNYIGGPPVDFPSILDRLTLILADPNITIHSMQKCLTTLKEEWLNKSKLLFQLTKGHVMSNVDQNDNRYLNAFRKIAKCTKSVDELVVKFWQAGLSRQYKSFVLNKISYSQQQQHLQQNCNRNSRTVNSNSCDNGHRNNQPKL